MKRFLTMVYIVLVLGGVYWGIMWLENMRKQSAEEARLETEAALKQEKDDWLE